MQPWKRLQSQYIVQTPYVNVRKDTCQRPDGAIVDDYYVVEERDYGMVFAITPQHDLVMVRQYKHGIGRVLLELPAGYFDDTDANPAAACLREFREETGYEVAHYQVLGTHIRHPTRMTNRGHLLVATGAYPVAGQHLDANESIEVVLVPVAAALDKIRSGEIDAVGSVASIFLAWDHLTRTGKA